MLAVCFTILEHTNLYHSNSCIVGHTYSPKCCTSPAYFHLLLKSTEDLLKYETQIM